MRKALIVVGLATVLSCGSSNKDAAAAEAAKNKQAMQDATAKAADAEAKVKSLEEQNAALQTKASDLEKQLSEATAAKSQLEVQTAKLTEESGKMQATQTTRLSEKLLFTENSSALTAEHKRALDTIADALKQLTDRSVIVAGYTDANEAGGKDAKVKRWQLSTARAMEVAKSLVGRGVDPAAIGIAGFGEGRPAAPNDSVANRTLNRRVELALTAKDAKLGTVEVKPAMLK